MSLRIENLAKRSALLSALRRFFLERGFLEVETPLLSHEVIPELHIEPMCVSRAATQSTAPQQFKHWLQASPELHMKRLLAAGMQAIFQITRSFRDGEQGQLHNAEFTIVEWYRVGDDMQAGIDLLDHLLQDTLQAPPARRTSYAEAFQKHIGINPHIASAADLAEIDGDPPAGLLTDDKDEWLNLLLATKIEPMLGRNEPEILYQYPASQAALAKTTYDTSGQRVAERFELYWQGVELANGYDELTNAEELRSRIEQLNAAREEDGRSALPLPESLLSAMEQGLPACSGCALGFDRLAMLACGAESLDEVIPFRFT